MNRQIFTFLLVCVLSLNNLSFSQKLLPFELREFRFDQFYGKQIIDKETHQAVAYVNVGVLHKSLGTVSDENGFFRLRIEDELSTDTLRISHIGYQTLDIPLAVFKETDETQILLERKNTVLNETLLKPNIFKEKVLGNKKERSMMTLAMEGRTLGYEMGILLPIKNRSFLKEFNLPIQRCMMDSIFFRLNFYKQIADNEYENILYEPIYIHQKMTDSIKNILVDLRPYNIVVSENTLVTLENVKLQKEAKLYVYVQFNGKKTYGRSISQDVWGKFPLVTLCMSVKADVEK